MKIGIIGAGNMGGAIARGIAKNPNFGAENLVVTSPNLDGELDRLADEFPNIKTSASNLDAVKGTDYIVIAVKPWLLGKVLDEISESYNPNNQTIVSIVAGVSCNEIEALLCKENSSPRIIRLIPNTAIVIGESMTFVSPNEAAKDTVGVINELFATMGKSMIVEERLMGAGTSLASCGIAFAMRYIRAASEGGVELGFYANDAKEIVMQAMVGAVKLIEANNSNPETEIDKVTTPGGLTIKGLNAMEKYGFTTAIIEGLKASVK